MGGRVNGSGVWGKVASARRFLAFLLTAAMVSELVPAQGLQAVLPQPAAQALEQATRTEAKADEDDTDEQPDEQPGEGGTNEQPETPADGQGEGGTDNDTPSKKMGDRDKITVDDAEKEVVFVSDGFYQDAATYDASTDFYITSKAGLEYFSNLVNGLKTVAEAYASKMKSQTLEQFYTNNLFTSRTVHLLCDINLNYEPWTPIGYQHQSETDEVSNGDKVWFYGNFNGHGHTISNLTVDTSNSNNNKSEYGLFGRIGAPKDNGVQTFSNLTISNVTIPSGSYVGTFVGNASSNPVTFKNCKVTGTVNISGSYAGGLCGIGEINAEGCAVSGTGTISGTYFAGGIVGAERHDSKNAALSLTDNNVSNVTVTSAQYAGGLIGAMASGAAGASVTINANTVSDVTTTGTGATNPIICENTAKDATQPQAQVAVIGNTYYNSLANAVAVAKANDTITIITPGESYKVPGIKQELTNLTIEAGKDVDVTFDCTSNAGGNIAGIGAVTTFKNVAFKMGYRDLTGFFSNPGMNFEGCTFTGKFYTYGTETYKNCTFVQDKSDYNMWVYGGANHTVTYDGCTFKGNGKFLNVYNHGSQFMDGLKLIVKNCTFDNGTNAANKAPLNLKETGGSRTTILTYTVEVSDCTLVGAFPVDSVTDTGQSPFVFGNGLIQVDDRPTTLSSAKTTISYNGTEVWKQGGPEYGEPTAELTRGDVIKNTAAYTVDLVSQTKGTEEKPSELVAQTSVDITVDGTTATSSVDLDKLDTKKLEDSVAEAILDAGTKASSTGKVVVEVRDQDGNALSDNITPEEKDGAKTAIFNAAPYAVAYDGSGVQTGKAQLSNDALGGNAAFTFRLPVPSGLASENALIKVEHQSDDDSDDSVETSYAYVKKDTTSDKLYVDVTVTHFSKFTEISTTDTNKVAYVNGTTYETVSAAINAATNGQTVYLLKDTTEAVSVSKDVTLDLNGYALTATEGVKVSGTATLTVVAPEGGTLKGSNGTAVSLSDTATLIIADKNVTVDGKINASTGTTVTLSEGKYTAKPDDNFVAVDHTTVTQTQDGNTYYVVTPVYTITYRDADGTTTFDTDTYNSYEGKDTLNAGTKDNYVFKGWYQDAEHTTKVESIATGEYGDKTLYGSWNEAVASATVNGVTTLHDTLEAAIEAAYNGGTVTLLKDVSYAYDSATDNYNALWEMNLNKGYQNGPTNLTIDGSSHTWTIGAKGMGNGNHRAAENGDYLLRDCVNLTVKNLTVDLTESSCFHAGHRCNGFAPKSGSFENVTFKGGTHALNLQWVTEGEKVTIKNCTFEAVNNGNAPGAFYTQDATKVEVTNSQFINSALSINGTWVFTGNKVITEHFDVGTGFGGTFTGNDLSNAKVTLYNGAKNTIDLSGNWWGESVEPKVTVKSGDARIDTVLTYDPFDPTASETDPATVVARRSQTASGVTTDIFYTKLSDAIDAASEGDVITLMADVTSESESTVTVGKSVTVELAGHTLKSAVTVSAEQTLTITDSGATSEGTTTYGSVTGVITGDGALSIKGGQWSGLPEGAKVKVGATQDSEPRFTSGEYLTDDVLDNDVIVTSNAGDATYLHKVMLGEKSENLWYNVELQTTYTDLASALGDRSFVSGQTIRLLKSATLTSRLNITKNVVLDLNGKKLASPTSGYALYVGSGVKTVTLTNSASTQAELEVNGSWGVGFAGSGVDFTIDGDVKLGKRTCNYAIYSGSNKITLKGGELEGTYAAVFLSKSGASLTVPYDSTAKLKATGGSVNGPAGAVLIEATDAAPTVSIFGGTFIANEDKNGYATAIRVKSGSVAPSKFIGGGWFSAPVAPAYVMDGYRTSNEKSTDDDHKDLYTVTSELVVASVKGIVPSDNKVTVVKHNDDPEWSIDTAQTDAPDIVVAPSVDVEGARPLDASAYEISLKDDQGAAIESGKVEKAGTYTLIFTPTATDPLLYAFSDAADGALTITLTVEDAAARLDYKLAGEAAATEYYSSLDAVEKAAAAAAGKGATDIVVTLLSDEPLELTSATSLYAGGTIDLNGKSLAVSAPIASTSALTIKDSATGNDKGQLVADMLPVITAAAPVTLDGVRVVLGSSIDALTPADDGTPPDLRYLVEVPEGGRLTVRGGSLEARHATDAADAADPTDSTDPVDPANATDPADATDEYLPYIGAIHAVDGTVVLGRPTGKEGPVIHVGKGAADVHASGAAKLYAYAGELGSEGALRYDDVTAESAVYLSGSVDLEGDEYDVKLTTSDANLELSRVLTIAGGRYRSDGHNILADGFKPDSGVGVIRGGRFSHGDEAKQTVGETTVDYGNKAYLPAGYTLVGPDKDKLYSLEQASLASGTLALTSTTSPTSASTAYTGYEVPLPTTKVTLTAPAATLVEGRDYTVAYYREGDVTTTGEGDNATVTPNPSATPILRPKDVGTYYAVATAVDGGTYARGSRTQNVVTFTIKGVVASAGGVNYATLQEAVSAATARDTVTLLADVSDGATIKPSTTVTIDLAGHSITAASGADALLNQGTLTVVDSVGGGVVRATASGHAAVANIPGATATLKGGTLQSDLWYAIKNLGTMTIDGAVTVSKPEASTDTSSLIANGWYDSVDLVGGTPYAAEAGKASLTIVSGSFVGAGGQKSCSVVKNDDYGTLVISGGTFDSTANGGSSDAATLLNFGTATVSGGYFVGSYPISNGYFGDAADPCQLTITGGTFKSTGDSLMGAGGGNSNPGDSGVTISGGYFDGVLAGSDKYRTTVSGGFFTKLPGEHVKYAEGFALSADAGSDGYGYHVVASPKPIAAKLHDNAKSGAIPDEDLITGYTATSATAGNVVTVTYGGTGLRKHTAGNGAEAYWLGVGIPALASVTGATSVSYAAGWGVYDAVTNAGSATTPDGAQTEGGTTFDTFYFGGKSGRPGNAFVVATYRFVPTTDGQPSAAVTTESSYAIVYQLDFSKVESAVAKVEGTAGTAGTSYHATLAAALAAAGDGDTVTLLTDATEGAIPLAKNVAIDLGGKTLTLTGKLTVSEGTVSITDGAIDTQVEDLVDVCAVSGKTATVTLGKDLAVTGTESLLWVHEAGSNTVVVDGASLTTTNADYKSATAFVDGATNTIELRSGTAIGGAYCANAANGGTLRILGGELSCSAARGTAVYVRDGGKLEMSGGSVSSATGAAVVLGWGKSQTATSTATISGGTLSSSIEIATLDAYAGSSVKISGASTTISNTGAGAAVNARSASDVSIVISGGSFAAKAGDALTGAEAYAVSGGRFSSTVHRGYCASGYAPSEYDAEKDAYTVVKREPLKDVATVISYDDSPTYTGSTVDVQQLVVKAGNGEGARTLAPAAIDPESKMPVADKDYGIILTADGTRADYLVDHVTAERVNAGTVVTFKLVGVNSYSGEVPKTYTIAKAALTRDNTTVTVADQAYRGVAYTDEDLANAVTVTWRATPGSEPVTLTAADYAIAVATDAEHDNTTVAKGGKVGVAAQDGSQNFASAAAEADRPSATYAITPASFTVDDIEPIRYTGGEIDTHAAVTVHPSYAPDTTITEGFTVTSFPSAVKEPGAYQLTVTGTGDFAGCAVTKELTITAAVASITAGGATKYYGSLAEAVGDVPTTGVQTTIRLLQDAAGPGVKVQAGQNVVFDLGGHSYEVTKPLVGSPGTETNGFQMLKGSTVAFRNGTLTSSSALILLQNYSTLTLGSNEPGESLVIAPNAPALYAVSNNFGSMAVTGDTTIKAAPGQVAFDLWYGMSATYDDGVSVTFDKGFTGRVEGTVEYGAAGRAGTDGGWVDKATLRIDAPEGSFDVSWAAGNAATYTLDQIKERSGIVVSAGSFSSAVPDGFAAPGLAPTEQDPVTGRYTVAPSLVGTDVHVTLVKGSEAYDVTAEDHAAGPSYDYDGSKQVPTVVVTRGAYNASDASNVIPASAYAVNYLDKDGDPVAKPTDAARYGILLTGKGAYAGSEKTVTNAFTIEPAEITAVAEPATDLVFDGTEQTGYTVPSGAHYRLAAGSVAKATDHSATSYTVTLEPESANYVFASALNPTNGKVQKTWNVGKAKLASGNTTVHVAAQAFTNDAITPAADDVTVVFRSAAGKPAVTLRSGADYGFASNPSEGKDNTTVAKGGSIKLTAGTDEGGNFMVPADTITKDFAIEPAAFTAALKTGDDAPSFVYNDGKAVTFAEALNADGSAAYQGTPYTVALAGGTRADVTAATGDYTIIYGNNYAEGDAMALFVGRNNLTGTAQVGFHIGKKTVTLADVLKAVADGVYGKSLGYTGGAQAGVELLAKATGIATLLGAVETAQGSYTAQVQLTNDNYAWAESVAKDGSGNATVAWSIDGWALTLPYTPGTLTYADAAKTVVNGATFAPTSLGWSPVDASVGRMSEGYWVGYLFHAPAAVTAEVAAYRNASTADAKAAALAAARATYSSDGGATWKKFAQYQDGIETSGAYEGRAFMQAWVPLTTNSVVAALKSRKPMSWTYKFAWDGNQDTAQTFTITVDPSNVELTKDGKMTLKAEDGKVRIDDFTLTLADASQTYTGSALAPTPTLKSDITTLALGSDYTLEYRKKGETGDWLGSVTDAGTYDVRATVVPGGTFVVANAAQTVSADSFTIAPRSLAAAVVTLDKGSDTFGSASYQTAPKVARVALGETLLAEADYEVVVPAAATTTAGTYTVTVTGDKNYKDSATATYTLAAKPLTDATVAATATPASATYTGSAISVATTLTDGETDIAGDATVTYADATGKPVDANKITAAGSYTATFTAEPGSDYAGTRTATFEIARAKMSAVTVAASDATYDAAAKPIGDVTLGGFKLTEGVDFDLVYTPDNVNPGTVTATLAGLGNFEGVTSKTYTIAPIGTGALANSYTKPSAIATEANGDQTITFSGVTLSESPAEPSIGRNVDACWAGFDIVAPAGVTETFLKNGGRATYTRTSDRPTVTKTFVAWNAAGGKATGNFDGVRDGRYYMQAWVPLTDAAVKAALDAGLTSLTWGYDFDWDGDGSVDQHFDAVVDLTELTLLDQAGTKVTTKVENGELTVPADIPEVARAEAAADALLDALQADGTGATWKQVIQAARYYKLAVAAVDEAEEDTTQACDVAGFRARLAAVADALAKVEALDLSGQDIFQNGFYSLDAGEAWNVGSLEPFTGLRRLNLAETGIANIGALAGLSKLEELDLSGNEGIGDAEKLGAVAALAGTLKRLNLSGTGLDNGSFGPVVALSKLEELYLADNPGLTAAGPLAALKKLVVLDLSNTSVAAIGDLAGCTALEVLDVSGTRLPVIQEVWGGTAATWPALTELYARDLTLTSVSGLVELVNATGADTTKLTWDLGGSLLEGGDPDDHVGMIAARFYPEGVDEAGTWIPPEVEQMEIVRVEGVSDVMYTGKEQTFEGLKVYDHRGGEVPAERGYHVSYLNNVNVGEAAVIVSGAGNYHGTLVERFSIKANDTVALAKKLDEAYAEVARVAVSDAEGGSDLEPGTSYVTSEEQAALDEAIGEAEAARNEPNLTEDEIKEAFDALAKALKDYQDAERQAAVARVEVFAPALDEGGNPVVDEDGNPVMELAEGYPSYYADIDDVPMYDTSAGDYLRGAAITLLADVTIGHDNARFTAGATTLDLAGHTLTLDGKCLLTRVDAPAASASLTIDDSQGGGRIVQTGALQALQATGGASLTVKSGTVRQEAGDKPAILVRGAGTTLSLEGDARVETEASVQAVEVGDGAAATLKEGAVVSAPAGYGVALFNAEATGPATSLTVDGGRVEAGSFAVSNNGGATQGATKITVNAGSLASTGAAALYLPGVRGATEVHGGELRGASGIEIRGGKLLVDGGSVTATAVALSGVANAGGSTTEGAGIAVVQHVTRRPIGVTVTDARDQAGNVIGSPAISGVVALYENDTQGNEDGVKLVVLDVSGGSFKGSKAALSVADADEPLDPSSDATPDDGAIRGFVTGGSFSSPVPLTYAAPGYANVPQAGADGLYTVAKSLEGHNVRVSPERIDDQVRTGEQLTPEVKLLLGGQELDAAKDYAVEYGPNVEVGTGSVTITGRGDYTGELALTFDIVGAKLEDIAVTGKGITATTGEDGAVAYEAGYTGVEIVPTATVAGTDLETGQKVTLDPSDYDVRVLDEDGNEVDPLVDAGRYTVVATPKEGAAGGFGGSISAPLTVTPASLEGAEASETKPYAGPTRGVTPDVTDAAGRALEAGKDYTASYERQNDDGSYGEPSTTAPTEPGTYRVSITGTGNYEGAQTFDFEVTKVALKTLVLSAVSAKLGDDDAVAAPTVEVVGDEANHEVSADSYELTWYDADGTEVTPAEGAVTFAEAGTYTATVRPSKAGAAYYEGKATARFVVAPQESSDLADASVAATLDSSTYDGLAKAATVEVTMPLGDGSYVVDPSAYELSYLRTKDADGTELAPAQPVSQIVDAGTYQVVATAKDDGPYENAASTTVTVSPAALSAVRADPTKEYPYTGSAVTLGADDVVVTGVGGAALTYGEDFDIVNLNNTTAGQATAVVTGKGNYLGSRVALGFTIVDKAALTSAYNTAGGSIDGEVKAPVKTMVVLSDAEGQKETPSDMKYVTSELSTALHEAWTLAADVLADEDATQAEVDLALSTLKAAQAAYNAGLKTGGNAPLVQYVGHVQNIGWQNGGNYYTATLSNMMGTTGRSLRVEAYRMRVVAQGGKTLPYTGSIQYTSHVQNIGWQDGATGFRSAGRESGTTGRSLRVEAVKIKLTGELANHYDIYYTTHVQNIGWMAWAKNGAICGSSGRSLRMEAIKVVLVPKGGKAPTRLGTTNAVYAH